MEHSMDNLSVSMILFPTRTILNGEIIRTYAMGTRLNKAIKADSSIPMDFSPNRIIKQYSPPAFTNSNVMGLWSADLHEMMKTSASNTVTLNKMSCLFNKKQGQVFIT
jgi:hypothetical protein